MSIQGFPFNSSDGIDLPISILNGGTGANNTDDARTNLEAASIGANSDITSLNNLSSIQVGHIAGNSGILTIIASTGAGDNAIVSIAGNDLAGTISIITDSSDTPSASSTICEVLFATAYLSTPRILIMPSNAASWSLSLGVVQCIQADVTTTRFKLKSGEVPLPATTLAQYLFNYIVVQ